jgi:hypothetical protein
MSVAIRNLLNARPHPASLGDLRLASRAAITNHRDRSHAGPSPGGEGQGEGGRHAIQSAPQLGCHES